MPGISTCSGGMEFLDHSMTSQSDRIILTNDQSSYICICILLIWRGKQGSSYPPIRDVYENIFTFVSTRPIDQTEYFKNKSRLRELNNKK